MRAAVFTGPDAPLSIQDIDKPEIAEDELLVRVSHCGICGTDIHASRSGPFQAPPNTVFGHEFSGDIAEVGAALGDSGFAVGDRVTSLPFIKDQTIGLGAVTGTYDQYAFFVYPLGHFHRVQTNRFGMRHLVSLFWCSRCGDQRNVPCAHRNGPHLGL